MIIQIRCSQSKIWHDRCQCPPEYVDKEIDALKRIYTKNEFRVIEGDKKLPGPIYHNKPEWYIDDIVAGIEWLDKQPRDSRFPLKAAKVMQGKIKRADMVAIDRFEKMQNLLKRSLRRQNETKRKS